jgi:transposase-like protein
VRDVFSETRWQRDWVHKRANVLDALPESAHRRVKKAIHEITEAENKTEGERAAGCFAKEFGAKWPETVVKILESKEALLAFYEVPTEHWIHLRTTSPIRSTFAPDRARTDVANGPGPRDRDDIQACGGD